MPKASIELVHETLTNNQLAPDKIQKILKELEQQAAAEAEAEKANREPPVKKQYVILVSDPHGTLPADVDYVGWVAQIPEDDPACGALDRIHRATHEYNISKKGRKYPCRTVGESCEAVGARYLKEQGIAIKTKAPVLIQRTDNQIPQIEDTL
jgi:hypothetical protein